MFRARGTFALLLLAALFAFALASGCGGAARDESSGIRFLLASSAGLSEVALEGGQRDLVTFNDRSYVLDPAISPDGSQIAFIRQPPASIKPDGSTDFGSDLYIADRNGRNLREVVKHQQVAEFVRTPAWLSNEEIIFTVRGRDSIGMADLRIEKLNLRTGQRERFVQHAVDPAVSPDRQWIAYVRINPRTQEEELIIADAANRNPRAVVGWDDNLALMGALAFSPDSNVLAFAAVDLLEDQGARHPSGPDMLAAPSVAHPFAQDIWTVDRDGSGLRRLADLGENMPSITWSADGKLLYVLGPIALWQVDPATKEAVQIGGGIPLAQIVLLP
jgi:Tol biopolymer transport system component